MFRVLKKYCVTTPILTPSIFCMENNENNQLCNVSKIKSNFILKRVFTNLQTKKKLDICKYNKRIKGKVNIDIEDYIDRSRTIITFTVENDKYFIKQVPLFNIIISNDIYNQFIAIKKNIGEKYAKEYLKQYTKDYNLYLNNKKIEFEVRPRILTIREKDKNCYMHFSHYPVIFCKYSICIGESKFRLKINRNIHNLTALFANCNRTINFQVENSKDNLTNLNAMFYGCKKVQYFDLKNLNTTNVRSFSDMFCQNKNITYLNISNFNTGHAITVRRMFGSCSSLKILHLNNLVITNNMDTDLIVSSCYELEYIIIDDDNTRRSFKGKIINGRASKDTYGVDKDKIKLIKSIDDVEK